MTTARAFAIDALHDLPGEARPDSALVARCLDGDAEAFSQLVVEHESMAWSLATRLIGDAEEAREVCQEVFLQVHRTLARFEGRSSLRTWIYRIVVNRCRNRRRFWQRLRRRREQQRPLDEALIADPRADPECAAQLNERTRRLYEALRALSFEHRTVLLLREVEGLSCEEVSATLGIATGTVKSRLARAREALRRALMKQGGWP